MSRKMAKNDALPKGWQRVKIIDFSPLQRGFDLPTDQIKEGTYPVVYSNGINNYHSEYKSKAPGVVTGRSGTIGEVTYVIQDYWPHNTSLWVTDFKDNHPKFVFYALQNLRLNRFHAGSGVPTLNRNDVHKQSILVPPPSEQKAIASLLETWDTAVEKTEALIAAKEKQFKWLLKTLISDQQDNPEWRKVKLGELGVIHSGGTPSTQDSSNWNGDIFWLTPSEVTKLSEKYICSTERQITQKGLSHTTLLPENCLIVCTRATIGDCCINTVPMAINQGFKCIQPHKDYSVIFLYYTFQLLKAQLVRISCGNTFGEVSKKDFANILISVPSLFEQKAIAAYLNTAQQEIITLKQLAEQYCTQKRGLMQKLLTGKWRIMSSFPRRRESRKSQ